MIQSDDKMVDDSFEKFKDDCVKNWTLIIDIVGGCNAQCPFCPTGRKWGAKFDIMSPTMLEKILIHLRDEGIILNSANEMGALQLYCYGEPFLHPNLNLMLEICYNYHLRSGLSSNFIKLPNIKPENFEKIAFMVFSINSFEAEEYKKIYGAELNRVLDNYQIFIEEKKKYNDNMILYINWLKYKSTPEKDLQARSYFESLGCLFRPITAFLNNRSDMLDFVKGITSSDELENIKKYIDPHPFTEKIKFCSNDKFYQCSQLYNVISVNEKGDLYGCCIDNDKSSNLGNILTLSREEILARKYEYLKSKECRNCASLGIGKFIQEGLLED